MQAASKKRKIGEITKTYSSGNKSLAESDAKTLWIEKYAPKTMDELVINKNKVKEFVKIAEENGGGGFLTLMGAPGSCKNALIDAYCNQNDIKLIKHSDVKTQHLDELYGQKKTIGGYERSAIYPDDLESLVAFIRKLTNSAGN